MQDTLAEAHKIIADIKAENKGLRETIHKRNRHVESLKVIIRDLKGKTDIILKEDDFEY